MKDLKNGYVYNKDIEDLLVKELTSEINNQIMKSILNESIINKMENVLNRIKK